jgi:hypothetical protein
MVYPVLSWGLQPTLSFSTDNVGPPALVVTANDTIYYAAVAKGVLGAINTGGSYSIIIGKISAAGSLLWQRRFPQLTTTEDQSTPALLLGPAGELYVAFVTLGATPSNLNMANVPSFCNPCPATDPHDVVLARIDEPVPNNPTVSWVLQNSSINSCAKDTVPKLAFDARNNLLYICIESTLAIQCFRPIGSKNIFVGCFRPDNGAMIWSEGGLPINSLGENTNPVIAADNNGGLYIGFETTQTILGGASISSPQVEVVKYQTVMTAPGVLGSYTRSWVLSGITTALRPPTGTCKNIALTTDPTRGTLFVTFATTGTITGGTKVNGGHDLVVASLSPAGALLWSIQGPTLNPPLAQYSDCANPYVISDSYGNVYVSLQTIVSGPTQNVLVYKINPGNGEMAWKYGAFTAYALVRSGFPNSLFPSLNNAYSPVSIARSRNNLIMGLATTQNLPSLSHTSTGNDLCIVSFSERSYAVGFTPYTYISSRVFCECDGGATCSCGQI